MIGIDVDHEFCEVIFKTASAPRDLSNGSNGQSPRYSQDYLGSLMNCINYTQRPLSIGVTLTI